MKKINLNDSIYHLVNQYREVKDILYSLGFTDIIKPGMIQTLGRIMTPIKGAIVKQIPIEKIKLAFIEQGFDIEGEVKS